MKDAAWPIARGTFIGAILGILPGNGAVLGPFAAYTVEKKLAKDPSRFGRGAIEGVRVYVETGHAASVVQDCRAVRSPASIWGQPVRLLPRC
jgi:TctA family transporter